MAEYHQQSREYTARAVARLKQLDEFRHLEAFKEREERFQLSWLLGPVALIVVTYLDFTVSYMRVGSFTLGSFGSTATALGPGVLQWAWTGFICFFCAPLCTMCPFVGFYTTQLTQPELLEAVGAFFVTSMLLVCSGLPSLHRPPFLETVPAVGSKQSSFVEVLQLFAFRTLPLLAPMLQGLKFFRWKGFSSYMSDVKRSGAAGEPNRIAGGFFASLPVVTVWLGIETFVYWLAAASLVVYVRDSASDMLLFGAWAEEVHSGRSILQRFINPVAFASTLTVYCWVLLFSTFVIVPLIAVVARRLQSNLPTTFSSWALCLCGVCGVASWLHSTGWMTIPTFFLCVSVGAMLLINGFET